MSRRSQNLAFAQSYEIDPEAEKMPLDTGVVENWTHGSEVALSCLQYMNPKEVADACGVAVRTIHKWIGGERSIPKHHIGAIIVKAKGFFMNLGKIEEAVDRLLINQYGHLNRGEF